MHDLRAVVKATYSIDTVTVSEVKKGVKQVPIRYHSKRSLVDRQLTLSELMMSGSGKAFCEAMSEYSLIVNELKRRR